MKISYLNGKTLIFCIFFLLIAGVNCIRKYTKDDIRKLREEVRQMFQHAYDGYLKYASKYDELRPLSCDGVDTWGSYSLTLIDALDTLAVMGNYTEFQRVVELLTNKSNFDSDINVSVFETNIRIVGGLLSAHLLSYKAGVKVEPGWPCNGPLLRLAEDVAKRLLAAFDSKTGMPYGTVNLKNGIPLGETSVTCTAGVGTFIVEFGALSRLTGDPIYEEVAMNALHVLRRHKSPIGLYGNHIDVQTGRWTAQDAGIGAGVDSYYEYLVKGSIMLNRPELMEMFIEGREAIDKYLKRDDWHVWVGMNKGQVTLPVFQSLEAYWPGVLSIFGDTIPAMKTLHNYHTVWKQYGFLPEFYNIPNAEAGANRENYPLRPELIESVMYLYRATGDPYLLEVGEDMLRSIEHSAKTPCGYATIKNVRDHRKEDRMESFFLAETTKYLYLLFDPDNFLNNDGGSGTIINTPSGECIIDAGGYIFNTEAHPIDPSALRCCYDLPRQNLLAGYDTKKFLGDVLEISSFDGPDRSSGGDDRQIFSETNVNQEETRKNIVAEIIKVLNEQKLVKDNKEKKQQQQLITKKDRVPTDDSIILPIEKPERLIPPPSAVTSSDPSYKMTDKVETNNNNITGKGTVVEVVHAEQYSDTDLNQTAKIQSDTTATTDFATYDENVTDNQQPSKPKTTVPETPKNDSQLSDATMTANQLKSFINPDNTIDEVTSTANSSMLTEFVQSLLKSTLPTKPKFNAQEMLEKIRASGIDANITKNYQLLTCKAQPYLQRITVLGEFF